MAEFKVGDRVVFIRDYPSRGVKAGDKGIVYPCQASTKRRN